MVLGNKKVLITPITNKNDFERKFGLLLATDEFANKIDEFTKLAQKHGIDVVSSDIDLVSNFFILNTTNTKSKIVKEIINKYKNKDFEVEEIDIDVETFKDLYEKENWSDDNSVVVTGGGFYLMEETEYNLFQSFMIDLTDIVKK